MNPALRTALFAYIEAGIASAIVLAYTGGATKPVDFLWAFIAGFAGPLAKALNPFDDAFGLKHFAAPATPHGTAQQEAIANEIAGAVTDQLASATAPALDKLAKVAEPVVAPVEQVVAPVIDAVTKNQ